MPLPRNSSRPAGRTDAYRCRRIIVALRVCDATFSDENMNIKELIVRILSLRRTRMLAVLAASGTVLVGLATPSWAAAPVTLTLSATQGSTTGGGMITASTPAGTSPFFPGVDVEFQVVAGTATSCAANYLTPSAANGAVDAGFPMVIAANRIGINLPSFGTAAAGTKYNVCVYTTNNTSGGLVAQTASTGLFSIGLKTSLFNAWPPAGPAQGGTTIMVSGANFPLPPATAPPTPLLTPTLGALRPTLTPLNS